MKITHKINYDLQKLISRVPYYYVNSNITTKNFPVPKKIETENWKLIRMDKFFTSQEALDKIKSENCRPANAYELALWVEKHREKEMPKGKWSSVIAFGQLWFSGDYHKVPDVYRDSAGDFKFDLARWEGGWVDNRCLLCFCDLSKNSDTFDS